MSNDRYKGVMYTPRQKRNARRWIAFTIAVPVVSIVLAMVG